MIRHVTPVPRRDATGSTARVYDGLRVEFGIHAEPIVLHSPAPELLAGAWMVCRETTVAEGRVGRAVKEAMAVEVSEANRCPYCVDAHEAMLRSTGDTAVAPTPPFDAAEMPELIGTAVLFHYINRPVSVFLDESPLPTRRRPLRGPMLALASRRFREFTGARPSPGRSLDLLPDADLPADMEWARGVPHIAGAWARFAAAAEAAGEDALVGDVREWLAQRLDTWHGEEPPLGGAWIDEALEDLDRDQRGAGRLVLLAALAPYRVDDSVVSDYRHEQEAGDRFLVGAVVWSALAAARRVGSWLADHWAVDSASGRSS